MTVLYTTNLALGQPVTGTESGTWGDDVNNSVTSYLDIAISGTLALTSASFTANALTLSNTLGDSSATNIGPTTAQYYALRLSSLAANVTITAPSVSKTYLIINSDATYSVVIKSSSGTGTSIAPGERATVYYNSAITDYIKLSSTILSNFTVDGTTTPGYLSIPQNAQTGSYTLVLADAGKHIYHASGAGAATYTIPANASVAYPIGTAVSFVNLSINAVAIAITSDTLTWAQGGGTGSRSLAQYGVANCIKITATQWLLTGTNVT
jgi:hypothetical protein